MSPRRFTFQFSHLKAVCIKEKLKPWCWFELECCAARVNKILHIYHLKSERFVRFHKNPTVIQSYFFRLHQMFTACVIMYLCVQRDLVLLDAITVSLMSLVYIRIVTGAVRLIMFNRLCWKGQCTFKTNTSLILFTSAQNEDSDTPH